MQNNPKPDQGTDEESTIAEPRSKHAVKVISEKRKKTMPLLYNCLTVAGKGIPGIEAHWRSAGEPVVQRRDMVPPAQDTEQSRE